VTNPLTILPGFTKNRNEKTIQEILTEKEVSNIVDGIKAYRLPSSFKTKKTHPARSKYQRK